ncbi:hypothetical protein LINBF2_03100 [Limnohabitans sp. INBF002]|nr:hypothetical protein LINBF2_03100 [Limnohabitans sp. INBF002]
MSEQKTQLLNTIKLLYSQLETANIALLHSKSHLDEHHVRKLEGQMNELINTLIELDQ